MENLSTPINTATQSSLSLNKMFNCWPVIIYSICSLITIVTSLFVTKEQLKNQGFNSKILYIIVNIISIIIGYLILYMLCKHQYYKTAWVVLLLPIFLTILTFILLFSLGFATGVAIVAKNKLKNMDFSNSE